MAFEFNNYRLRSISFSDLLTQAELDIALRHAQLKEYRKGQVLFSEGTSSKGIYILRKGKVKIYNSNADGKQSIIYIYQKAEFFGYRPILAGESHPVTAAALNQVVLTFIPKRVFEILIDNSPVFARKLLTCMASEFNVWIHKIAVFTQFSVKKRVALALMVLSNHKGNSISRRSLPVSLSIGREDLAGYVGTAKESLVRTLKVLKEKGIIMATGKKITILDFNTLTRELDHH
jgi:CRP-like cAMP-binding protein